MSFKKFLAPVVSCCCAISSLSSYCCATYKYSDLCAVEITDYEGLNATSDIEKLAREDKIVYVSKELENLLKQDNKKCAVCQQKMNLSEGFVVAHDEGTLHSYNNWIDKTLEKVLDDKTINANTTTVAGFINHLVCKKCVNRAIKTRPLADRKKPCENGLLRCPACAYQAPDGLGISLRSLKFLGEAIWVKRKDDLKELRNNIESLLLYLGPPVISCYLVNCLSDTQMAREQVLRNFNVYLYYY